jgi:hypothetical protein
MVPNVCQEGNSRFIPNAFENNFAYLFRILSTKLISDVRWLMSTSDKSKAVTLEIIILEK